MKFIVQVKARQGYNDSFYFVKTKDRPDLEKQMKKEIIDVYETVEAVDGFWYTQVKNFMWKKKQPYFITLENWVGINCIE